MRAAVIRSFGPPDVLQVEEVPEPVPRRGEILIRVRAVRVGGLLDVGTRAGRNHFARITFPHILGADFSGAVVAVDDASTDLVPGDRVAVIPFVSCGECAHCVAGTEYACAGPQFVGVDRAGSYAELCSVPARVVHRIPHSVSYEEAAAMALSGPVAWTQMVLAGLEPGDWILVTAAAGGLGIVTAQVAQLLGARVVATSRKDWKLRALEKLGVEAALNTEDDEFVDRVLDLTGGKGVRIAVDNSSSAFMFEKVAAVLARTGTIVCSGATAAERVPLDLRTFYTKSQRLLGVRTLVYRGLDEFWRLAEQGVRPLVDRSFPLEEVAAAHRYIEEERNFGRVLLTL